MVSLAQSLFNEAIPQLDLWDLLLGRPCELVILEDNQATIKVAKKGYSQRLRHVPRHHKVDLGSVKECLDKEQFTIEYCNTKFQAADIFTKGLAPNKWPNALELLGTDTKKRNNGKAAKGGARAACGACAAR